MIDGKQVHFFHAGIIMANNLTQVGVASLGSNSDLFLAQ